MNPRLVCFSLLLACPAQAGLYFYDAFDYAAGEDALTAAAAWADVRFPGSEADVEVGSLEYVDAAGRVLRTAGAKALVDTSEEESEVRHRAVLDLSSHQGPALWVSLLGRQTAGDARRFISLGFMAVDDTVQPGDPNLTEDEVFSLGVSSSPTPSGWSFANRSQLNGRQVAISTVPTSQTALLLARIELNADGGEPERYTFWANPPLGVAPPEAEGMSFLSADAGGAPASDFNQWTDLIAMRIGAGTPSGEVPATSWLTDEIRVGSDWADVLPWSPPLEWLEPLPAPGPTGWRLTWRPAPGRTDVVEWSTDLLQWTPYEASRHLGVEGESSAHFTAPPPPVGTAQYLLRVRRDP
jgi:hypothetical protein